MQESLPKHFKSASGAGTVADTLSALPVPPGPEHWIVQVLLELIAPVDSEPDEPFEPDHPFDAVHDVAGIPLVIDQLNVLDEPYPTVPHVSALSHFKSTVGAKTAVVKEVTEPNPVPPLFEAIAQK